MAAPPVIGGRSKWVVAAALVILVGFHVAILHRHYAGAATFPWDFLTDYQAQTFAWYGQGSVFDPPRWFPWSGLGFPAFWMLQSGGWYLPLALTDWLGIAYTVPVATAVQALHVLAGALGVMAWTRVLGLSWWAALAAALSWQFSAGFFSNQEHSDFIRAMALFPWLLWSLHPHTLRAHRAMPLVAAVLLFQFLVAAYPGMIVAMGYGGLAAAAVALSGTPGRRARIRLLGLWGAIGTAAVMMAGVKWLPVLLSSDYQRLVNDPVFTDPMSLPLVTTTLLPYDVGFLPNDVTMRSLWLPVAVWIGVALVRRRTPVALTGAMLILVAVGLGWLPPDGVPLPGIGLSRFPVSDWRPVFHLGVILLACQGWSDLFAGALDRRGLALRLLAAGLVAAVILGWGLTLGHRPEDLLRPLAALGLGAVIAVAGGRGLMTAPVGWLALAAVIGGEGMLFHTDQSRPWRTEWTDAVEVATYGVAHSDWVGRSQIDAVARRPERLVLGQNHAEAVRLLANSRYNECWFRHSYCVFGWNNLRLSRAYVGTLRALMAADTGPALLDFVRRPQQVAILADGEHFDAAALSGSDPAAEAVSLVAGARAEVAGYDVDRVRYRVATPVAVRVVENESWGEDWVVTLCARPGACQPPRPAEPTDDYLRSWTVPAGQWEVELRFVPRHRRLVWAVFAAGLAVAMAATAMNRPDFHTVSPWHYR